MERWFQSGRATWGSFEKVRGALDVSSKGVLKNNANKQTDK
jgi:hypothetical protein